jgi:tRNA dimethylallyltransferase
MIDHNAIIQIIINSFKIGMIPVIYGPTATWKTALSLELVKQIKSDYNKNCEIISADSRQVYKYMDIGTDKISQHIRNEIPHHLIDIVGPDEMYTAGQRQQDTYNIIEQIFESGNIPIIVWWTGLYIDTILFNYNMGIVEANWEYRRNLEMRNEEWEMTLWNMLYEIDPVEAAKHHPSSTRFIIRALEIYKQTWKRKSELMIKQDVKYPLLMIWLEQDVEIWNNLIDKRLEKMIDDWLIEEVQWLLDKGFSPELNSMKSIDYKQTIERIQNSKFRIKNSELTTKNSELTTKNSELRTKLFSDYMTSLQIANHQLSKKQRTRFRKYKKFFDTQPKNVLHLDFYLPDYSLSL